MGVAYTTYKSRHASRDGDIYNKGCVVLQVRPACEQQYYSVVHV